MSASALVCERSTFFLILGDWFSTADNNEQVQGAFSRQVAGKEHKLPE